jgi:hypothetical protein
VASVRGNTAAARATAPATIGGAQRTATIASPHLADMIPEDECATFGDLSSRGRIRAVNDKRLSRGASGVGLCHDRRTASASDVSEMARQRHGSNNAAIAATRGAPPRTSAWRGAHHQTANGSWDRGRSRKARASTLVELGRSRANHLRDSGAKARRVEDRATDRMCRGGRWQGPTRKAPTVVRVRVSEPRSV